MMAKHRVGGSAAQQLHVVDAVPAGDHGVDDGEQLAPRVGRARLVPRSTSWSAACSIPSRSAKVASSSSSALATTR
jgi:hypothetical protein